MRLTWELQELAGPDAQSWFYCPKYDMLLEYRLTHILSVVSSLQMLVQFASMELF